MLTTKYNVNDLIEVKIKEMPNIIHQYNRFMGGVDKFDQMIKYYTMKRKTNRWTQRFTVHIFEILLHNSYILYGFNFNTRKLSHYDFVESIISYLLNKAEILIPETKLCSSDKHHLPIFSEKRSNCKLCYKVEKSN